MADEPQNCPECDNSYLTVRTDIYTDGREFVYCDTCGCLADRRVWNRIAPAAGVKAAGELAGMPDSIDRAMTFEQQARDAYEREFQADSLDPSQAQRFDLFLRGYIASGVSPTGGTDAA